MKRFGFTFREQACRPSLYTSFYGCNLRAHAHSCFRYVCNPFVQNHDSSLRRIHFISENTTTLPVSTISFFYFLLKACDHSLRTESLWSAFFACTAAAVGMFVFFCFETCSFTGLTIRSVTKQLTSNFQWSFVSKTLFTCREITSQTGNTSLSLQLHSGFSCEAVKLPDVCVCSLYLYCAVALRLTFHIFPEPFSFESVSLFDRESCSPL